MTVFLQEFKKLFIKQYALVFIVLLGALKLAMSNGLWQADYGTLSPEQREQYLSYMEQYGGKLTDEKEQGIITLYEKLLDAKVKAKEHQERLNKGELDTPESYLESLYRIPDIIRFDDAITLLFGKYQSVSVDSENRLLIASDAPAMTIGMDYFLLVFASFITALSLYYERKMSVLNMTAEKNGKSVAIRLFCLFFAIILVQLIYSVIDFMALITEIGAGNLNISVASLESFKETPYPSLTIIETFIFIELARLLGALFTSAVAMIIMLISKNLILSAITPIAVNVLWIYYFGTSTESYYSPFALLRPSAYFTGRKEYPNTPAFYEYQMIEPDVFLMIIAVAVLVVAFACLLYIAKNKNKAKKRRVKYPIKVPFITTLLLTGFICSGCSNVAEYQLSGNAESAGYNFAYNADYFFMANNKAVTTHKDENGFIRTLISMYDDNFKLVADKLNRGVFSENYRIYRMVADENYLYYLMDDMSDDECLLQRIDLKNRTEETIYIGDIGALLNGTPKYLDMMTVWPDTDEKSVRVNDFLLSNDTVILFMQSGEVYTVSTSGGALSYLFEDVEVKYPLLSNGSLYYINFNNRIVRFDGEKTVITEKQYMKLTVDAATGKLYCQDADNLYLLDGKTGDATFICETENDDFSVRIHDGNILLVDPIQQKALYLSSSEKTEITGISDAYITEKGIVIRKEGNICYREVNNE